jgi:DNA-binding CsgD family transcriptional regulator
MLVGRSDERARIDVLLDGARSGRGSALVVRGEPGMGKSSLLAYGEQRADGMRVLRALGVEAEAELPFSGLYELLRPLLDLLGEIPERQSAALQGAFGLGPPVDARLLIGAGTLSLLSAAADERPLLCLVDDAQWLDAASADALVFAARRLDADAVAFLFAARDGDLRSFETPGLDTLVVGALSRDESLELLGRSGLPEEVAAELHRATTGNPLALIELPGALTEKQRLGEEPLPEPLPVTKAIEEAYARRIQLLSDPARAAVIVAAAEPSGDLAAIVPACASAGADASNLAEAEDAGLLTITEASVRFHHPLVTAAAYGGARADERRRAHAALADAVGARDPSRQAWHLAAAAAGPDERVAETLEEAARAAYARSGYRSAALMLERAAALTPENERRAERLYFAAILHFYSHGIARALTLLDDAEAAAGDDDRRSRYRLLRLALGYYRDPVRAATLLLEEAARLAPTDQTTAALAAGLAAWYRAMLRDGDGALEAALVTRQYDSTGGEDPFAGVGAGNGFVAAGRPGEAGPLAEHAIALFQTREWRYDNPEDWVQGYSGVFAAATLVWLGEHEALRARIESLASEFVPGDEVALMIARGLLGTVDFLGGRWAEARVGIADSLRLAREIGWLGPQVHGYARVLARLAAAQGSEEEVRAQEATGAPYAGIEWAGFVGSGAMALLALGRGAYGDAVAVYEAEVLPRIDRLVLYHDVADAAEAYMRAGDADSAALWCERFVLQAEESGWPWAQARAAYLQALAAGKRDYAARFEEALVLHERARQPFLQARTSLGYGERLRREGLRREARDHLHPALRTFERLGALPWAETAAAELRATGERVRRRSDPDTTRLTPQELQVALVVAQGVTNKAAAAQLFLSPKTIEKHLGSAYTKLGLSSRAELARLFAGQQHEVHA